MQNFRERNFRFWVGSLSAAFALCATTAVRSAETSDPLLDLFIQKGFVTKDEADKVKAEADALRAKTPGTFPEIPESKWKIGKGIKNVELFGDLRLRYEK